MESLIETHLTAADIARLFAPFRESEGSRLYLERDRLAAIASRHLVERDFDALTGFQSALRASFGIALASGLPTALFIESARLWRGKVTAILELPDPRRASSQRGSSISPAERQRVEETLRFNLLGYPATEYEQVLAATLGLSPGMNIQRLKVVLETAVTIDALRDWSRVSPKTLLGRLEELSSATAAPHRTGFEDPQSRRGIFVDYRNG